MTTTDLRARLDAAPDRALDALAAVALFEAPAVVADDDGGPWRLDSREPVAPYARDSRHLDAIAEAVGLLGWTCGLETRTVAVRPWRAFVYAAPGTFEAVADRPTRALLVAALLAVHANGHLDADLALLDTFAR